MLRIFCMVIDVKRSWQLCHAAFELYFGAFLALKLQFNWFFVKGDLLSIFEIKSPKLHDRFSAEQSNLARRCVNFHLSHFLTHRESFRSRLRLCLLCPHDQKVAQNYLANQSIVSLETLPQKFPLYCLLFSLTHQSLSYAQTDFVCSWWKLSYVWHQYWNAVSLSELILKGLDFFEEIPSNRGRVLGETINVCQETPIWNRELKRNMARTFKVKQRETCAAFTGAIKS